MDSTLLQSARQVLLAEARALEAASARLDGEFDRAVDLLAAHAGKVLVTGIGKSGHVGRKIASTLAPPPRARSRLLVWPGTRIMSPKVATVTPGLPARSISASTVPWLVTQTGQPGPLTRRTRFGRSERRPVR